jgi:hypothetical protein
MRKEGFGPYLLSETYDFCMDEKQGAEQPHIVLPVNYFVKNHKNYQYKCLTVEERVPLHKDKASSQ